MTVTTAPPCPCVATLLAARTALLDQAARNRRTGHPRQAETCERQASGLGAAVGVLRKAGQT